VVVLLLPLSLAMDNEEFDCSGGGGSSGGPVAAAAVAVAAVDYRDRWRWCLMAAAALDGGHATTSWCSKRAAMCGTVFGCGATSMARNRAMAVALEEEGSGKDLKSNGNCSKVGNCKQQQQRQPR
jgi:hypothetical protein